MAACGCTGGGYYCSTPPGQALEAGWRVGWLAGLGLAGADPTNQPQLMRKTSLPYIHLDTELIVLTIVNAIGLLSLPNYWGQRSLLGAHVPLFIQMPLTVLL